MPIQPSSAVLATLRYFPVTGFFIKLIMDVATSNNLTAVSTIIRDSCIALYLACMLWFLFSSDAVPKFGVFVIFTTLMVYATSITLNAANLSLIDGNMVEMMSDTNWVFAEIILLFSYMSSYVLNPSSTWLIGLLIIAMIHAFVFGSNYQSIYQVTDDATRNIKPID